MSINHNMMWSDSYGSDDFQDDNFSQPYYRYKNAYGDYRGGYDRGNQGPSPYGFGPVQPPQPPFPMFSDKPRRRDYGGDSMNHNQNRNRNIKHLIKCGLQRQQLIKLPGDLMNLMQPMSCGLCAQQFETYDLSKIHYLSKNHAKNIKKWMNQRSVSKGPKEPFRPRDHYCELCDVEITSKDHATSHYYGKPHRAIVEGRKNSRNPILLQPHMKTRLNILIRREKKFYKMSEMDTENKKTKPDRSTVPPELYCNICQVAMTCSEQMTTHLNGKKHLNKEKYHILKLMKGETPDQTSNRTTEGGGGEAEDKAEEDDEEQYDEDEEFDGEDTAAGEDWGGNKDAADDWGEDGDDWKPSAADY